MIRQDVVFFRLFGLMFFAAVVVPSLFIVAFHTNSMANGIFIVAVSYMLFLLVYFACSHQFQLLKEKILICTLLILIVIVIHGMISNLINDQFDLDRFIKSYALLMIFLAGAFSFVLLLSKVEEFHFDYLVKAVFYILLLSSVAGVLRISPFSPAGIIRTPVLFFNEPSHYALAILPFLLYMVVQSAEKKKILWIVFGYIIALLLSNLTMIIGVTLICFLAFPLKRFLMLLPLAVVLVLLNISSLDYYSSRIDVSNDNKNLSSLVFISGWERAYLSIKETNGLGVGFQQFGIIGSQGTVMEMLAELNVENLNLFDGGTVGSKFVGEFGLLAIFLLIFYLFCFMKWARWLHRVSIGKLPPQNCKYIFFVSHLIIYFVDLFVRGAGYFSSFSFFLVSALIWLMLRERDNIYALLNRITHKNRIRFVSGFFYN